MNLVLPLVLFIVLPPLLFGVAGLLLYWLAPHWLGYVLTAIADSPLAAFLAGVVTILVVILALTL